MEQLGLKSGTPLNACDASNSFNTMCHKLALFLLLELYTVFYYVFKNRKYLHFEHWESLSVYFCLPVRYLHLKVGKWH